MEKKEAGGVGAGREERRGRKASSSCYHFGDRIFNANYQVYNDEVLVKYEETAISQRSTKHDILWVRITGSVLRVNGYDFQVSALELVQSYR